MRSKIIFIIGVVLLALFVLAMSPLSLFGGRSEAHGSAAFLAVAAGLTVGKFPGPIIGRGSVLGHRPGVIRGSHAGASFSVRRCAEMLGVRSRTPQDFLICLRRVGAGISAIRGESPA